MAYFIKACYSVKDLINDQIKEICLVGRSNVGKSSLINVLANQKIAKTSNTPGRTQSINFYDFDNYRLVDLPGYGYANVPKSQHKVLSNLLSLYVANRTNLIAILQIIDLNVITELDISNSLLLSKKMQNHFLIFNKADKVNKSYFDNHKIKLARQFNKPVENLLAISCKNKTNIDLLKKLIVKIIKS